MHTLFLLGKKCRKKLFLLSGIRLLLICYPVVLHNHYPAQPYKLIFTHCSNICCPRDWRLSDSKCCEYATVGKNGLRNKSKNTARWSWGVVFLTFRLLNLDMYHFVLFPFFIFLALSIFSNVYFPLCTFLVLYISHSEHITFCIFFTLYISHFICFPFYIFSTMYISDSVNFSDSFFVFLTLCISHSVYFLLIFL